MFFFLHFSLSYFWVCAMIKVMGFSQLYDENKKKKANMLLSFQLNIFIIILFFYFTFIWSGPVFVCTIILHILHEGAETLLVICNLFTVNFVAFEQESRIIAYLRNKASSTKPFPKALKHDWKPSTQGWWLSRIIKKVDLSRLIQIFHLWKWEKL